MFYVFLANGFEELEAVAPIDFLKRAGVETVIVGVGGMSITGAHNIKIVCDCTEKDIVLDDTLQGLMLPGGMPGTKNLKASNAVCSAVKYAFETGKLVCAICAAPSVLGYLGLLNGKRAVCFPGFEDELIGAQLIDSLVCRDGNIITAKGAGVAVEFGLEVVKYLKGAETSDKIRRSVQCP